MENLYWFPVKLLKERSRKIIELENEWVNYIKS